MKKKIIIIGIVFLLFFSGFTIYPTLATNALKSDQITDSPSEIIDIKPEEIESSWFTWYLAFARFEGEIDGYYKDYEELFWVFNCTDVYYNFTWIVFFPLFGKRLEEKEHIVNRQLKVQIGLEKKFLGTLTENKIKGFFIEYDPLLG